MHNCISNSTVICVLYFFYWYICSPPFEDKEPLKISLYGSHPCVLLSQGLCSPQLHLRAPIYNVLQ